MKQKWHDTKLQLPTPKPIIQPDAQYYIVRTENWGEQMAMYLTDANGDAGWYTSYISKLIVPVTHYFN